MNMRNLLLSLVAIVIALLITTLLPPQRAENDIKSFVRAQYLHGVPYEHAARFGKSVVPELLNMLKNPNERKWWSNIIFTLGVIGDERAVEPLISFVEQDNKGEVDSALLSSLLSVHIALGHIASQGNDRSLKYLEVSAQPDQWRSNPVPWKFASLSREEIGTALAKSAITGLGISAHPRAIGALKHMQTAADTPEECKPAVFEALKLTGEIKAKGRMAVFSRHQ
jgi:hypothetical protein